MIHCFAVLLHADVHRAGTSVQVHSNKLEVDRLVLNEILWFLASKSCPELLDEELDLLVRTDDTDFVDEGQNG